MTGGDGAQISKRRRSIFAAVSVAVGFAVAFATAELLLRIRHGELFEIRDLRPAPWGLPPQAFAEYDPVLGHVPRPGGRFTWRGGWSATIDGDRLRSNGNAVRTPAGQPILAVGDSSAFGDEVEDHESWPAHLERRVGRRVLNGGVGGYGIDQIVLRAARLLPRHQPEIVVLSFVSDDVDRCAYSYLWRWRPYFRLEGDTLIFVPPPRPEVPLEESAALVALGHSHLARFVLRRALPEVWDRSVRRRAHRDEREIATRMLSRLGREVEAEGSRLLVVGLAGANANLEHVPFLLAHAQSRGIDTLDLSPELSRAARAPAERARRFRPHLHPAPETNDWIAGRIAMRLAELGWIGAPRGGVVPASLKLFEDPGGTADGGGAP